MSTIRTLDHLDRSRFSLVALEAEDEVRHRDRIDGIETQIRVLQARKASLVGESVKTTSRLGRFLREAGVEAGEKIAVEGHVFLVTHAACHLLGPDAPSDDADDDISRDDVIAEWRADLYRSCMPC